jgi:hypothetical protein
MLIRSTAFGNGTIDRACGNVRLPPVGYANDFDGGGLGSIDIDTRSGLGWCAITSRRGYANDLMGVIWVRLPPVGYANDLGVVGFDRVWGDVRLPPVGYANDFDGDGFGSIDFVVGFDRCLDSIESWI